MLIRTLFGIFLILHGLVHLLYFGLSRKYFDLGTPLTGWPERSWVFSNFLADASTRGLASVLYAASMLLFVVSGVGFLMRTGWSNPLVVGAAVVSSAVVFLFWDGGLQRLPDKGFVGVLINVAIISVILLLDRSVIAL